MTVDLTDKQVREAVMQLLVKKGRWGAHYLPLDTVVNWLGKKVLRNGKRVGSAIKDLVKEGYLFLHKKGRTISLNPSKSSEILDLLKQTSENQD